MAGCRVRLIGIAGAAIGLIGWALLAGGTAAAPAQPTALGGALACDAHQPALSFPLQAGSAGGQPLLQPPAGPNAALDVGLPRLAAICQAVFAAPDASSTAASPADAFSLPAGSVSFSVSGPGLIVEGASQLATVACGSAAQGVACSAAAAATDTSVSGNPALAVHVVLLPTASLPALPAVGAITVQATYVEDPALGTDTATAQTTIDLKPPDDTISASADQTVVASGPDAGIVITARLRHALPENCTPLGGGPYLFCRAESTAPGDAGVETGTVAFTTTLGAFPNGATAIDAACGSGGSETPLVVPPPGVDAPFPYACSEARVRLSAAGFAGEATITAMFTGMLTGATAQASLIVTIAPRPATLQLAGGCTPVQVPQSLPAAAPVADLVGSVSPASAVVAVWRHDAAGGWQAVYLRDSQAPVDGATVDPGQMVSVCVDALAQYPLG